MIRTSLASQPLARETSTPYAGKCSQWKASLDDVCRYGDPSQTNSCVIFARWVKQIIHVVVLNWKWVIIFANTRPFAKIFHREHFPAYGSSGYHIYSNKTISNKVMATIITQVHFSAFCQSCDVSIPFLYRLSS